jgi:hypothetical protein
VFHRFSFLVRFGVVAPMRSWLDCPVPRLTLLFFGAAKDVPEAAKMVTARTVCLMLPAICHENQFV